MCGLIYVGYSYLASAIDSPTINADKDFTLIYALLFSLSSTLTVIYAWAASGFFFLSFEGLDAFNEDNFSRVKNEIRKIRFTLGTILIGLVPFDFLAAFIAFYQDLFVNLIASKFVAFITLLALSCLLLFFGIFYTAYTLIGYKSRQTKLSFGLQSNSEIRKDHSEIKS